jgi:hypothetical protein
MTINNKETKAEQFAYDGCHKIYLLESAQDVMEARFADYQIHPISSLREAYNKSCGLQFISNWKLDTSYVEQFETWE